MSRLGVNKQRRAALAAVLATAVVVGGVAADTARAAGEAPTVLYIGRQTAEAGGKAVPLDAAPVLSGDTTLVPLRFLAESLGAAVGWDEATRSVSLSGNGRSLRLSPDSLEAELNGAPLLLDVAPRLAGDTLLVPLRVLSEQLGARVEYEAETGRITVLRPTPASPAAEPASANAQSAPVAAPSGEGAVKADPGAPRLLKPKVLAYHRSYGSADYAIFTPASYPNFSSTTYKSKETIGFAVDAEQFVYLLQSDETYGPVGNAGYSISKIVPSDGSGPVSVRKFNQQFNFSYVDAKEMKRTYRFDQFVPEKLAYNDKNGKIYVYGTNKDPDYPYGALMYEVYPEVALAASIPVASIKYAANNFIAFPDAFSVLISNMESGDIFEAKLGGTTRHWGYIRQSTDSERSLHAAAEQDGSLLVYDSGDHTVRKISSEGSKLLKSLTPTRLNGATVFKGRLYLSMGDKVMEADKEGTVKEWLDLTTLTYPSDPFPPGTSSQLEIHKGSNLLYQYIPDKIGKLTWYGFTPQGVIFLLDGNGLHLRSIHSGQ